MYGIFVKCLEKSYLPGKKLFTSKERNVRKNNEMSGKIMKCLEKSYLPGKKEMSGKIMKCLEFF